MKKLGICLVLFFFVFGTSCFAQSSNDAQRIVGVWRDGSRTVTFNANGTYTYSGSGRGDNDNGSYFVSGSNLIIKDQDCDREIYDYYLSSDGRRLVLNYRGGSTGNNSPYLTARYSWFEKQ